MKHPPEDRYIYVGDVKARYWSVGQGPALICVHGILRFAEDWLWNIDALAENHRVYAVDLVGYGCTDKPDIDYTVDDFAAFINGFMIALGIERAALIGHSLGGGVVLNMAYRHPEKVERLVLVASAGLGQEVHLAFRMASLPMVGELCARPNRAIIARAFQEVVHDPAAITDEMVDQAYRRFYMPGAREALLKTIRAGLALSGVKPALLAAIKAALPAITVPTLIIWGKQDPVLPVSHALLAVENLPDARLRLLDECGHFPMFEHPQAFNALVKAFLAASAEIAAHQASLAEVAL